MDTNRTRDVWLTVLFVLLLLAGLAVLSLGIYLAIVRAEFIMLGLGLLAVTIPAAIYATLVWLASIASGWHYATDGMVGGLVVLVCYRLIVRPRQQDPAAELAPTLA